MQKIVFFFLFLNSLSAFSTDTMNLNVGLQSKQFTVTLPANPTTGYQWTLEQYDQSILKLTNTRYLPSQPKLMGSGGNMEFVFSRVQGRAYPKSTTMRFSYARSWEHGKGVMKKVLITFGK
jgi:inhibitor of cysteine peptidase